MENSSKVSGAAYNGARQDIPGPKGQLLMGSLPDIQRDRLGFMVELVEYWAASQVPRLGRLSVIQVSSPDGVQHVLQANNHNYA